MWRQVVVLVLGTAALTSAGLRLHREAREAGSITVSAQLLVGALCALVAALLVVTANADGIPDELEVPLAVVAVVAVVVLSIVVATRLAPRRVRGREESGGTRGQRGSPPPSSSRSPAVPRDRTRRMHSGP